MKTLNDSLYTSKTIIYTKSGSHFGFYTHRQISCYNQFSKAGSQLLAKVQLLVSFALISSTYTTYTCSDFYELEIFWSMIG